MTNRPQDAGQRVVQIREHVEPKTSKVDIDCQKLHDAFLEFQLKLTVTDLGEV